MGLLQYNNNAFINNELIEEMIVDKESVTYRMPSILDIIDKSYEKFEKFSALWKKKNKKRISQAVVQALSRYKSPSIKKLSSKVTL